jgi:hypothetical protein
MIYTGLQEALSCLWERYVTFTRLYKTQDIEKKPTNLNTFEVIDISVVSIL